MSETTPNLTLPYILPSQAQKHVTHNEALQRLDAIVQLTIRATLATPPGTPEEGACFLVDTGAVGLWSGKDGHIAVRQDSAWTFFAPRDGWRAWFAASGHLLTHEDGEWNPLPLPESGEMLMLGINATADTTNRLSLSAPATLLNNEGAGHQLKINKAASSDTASLLFQTGWVGHAEMGLAGDNGFSIKVSPDGSSWLAALTVTTGGRVHMPQRPLAAASMNSATATQAAGSKTGFQSLSVSQGGFALGAAISGGSGSRLVVPEDGFYLVSVTLQAASSGAHGIDLMVNGTTAIASIRNTGSGSTLASKSATAIAALSAGDWLSCEHSGSADVTFGPGKTAVTATML